MIDISKEKDLMHKSKLESTDILKKLKTQKGTISSI